jgi:excisionase family DNA binding protein
MTNLTDDLLTIPEAADALHVSVSTVRRWIRSGDLPAHRVGPKRVRVRPAELRAVVTPLGRRRVAITDLSRVSRNLSREDAARLDEAIAKSANYKARVLHGYPTPGWILIREGRLQRTAQLMQDRN